ncbi:MAG: N-acetylmuramoyl-L-alanine amidase [Bacteroidetes bacterium]|nr:N-acetylmuramoyl-L-alanine amidase [Bacteroidota bacterium]MBU1681066.1 N-acetylmuramoyl-L-alanine amidase [Bacteroidota bacterium]
MKLKTIILFFLIALSSVSAQRMLKLTLNIDGETKRVSYISRNGVTYASAKEIASALNGNYFYNDEAVKVELKFGDNKMKVTGKNSFYVIFVKGELAKTVQIPISTLMIKNDVYIPLIYSVKHLEEVSGRKLKFDDQEKHIASGEVIGMTAATAVVKDESSKNIASTKASKYDIYDLIIEEKANGILLRLKTTRAVHRFSSSIQDGKLFLFLSGVSFDPNLLSGFKPVGFINKANKKVVAGNLQLEFKLKDGYSLHESSKDVDSDDILITIHNKVFESPAASVELDKSKWVFDAVVIDAGHGGKDPGAIGITGVREKDVNLAVALKLGKLIQRKMPGVKVIYTRDNDQFVELYKRGKIANENNGKVFVSIHCNSLGKKNSGTRGFEVYLLRPGKTEKAIEIAEFENSVIQFEENPDRYQKLTDENFILVSMAHSAYMRHSEKFSDMLNQSWSKYVRRIPSRGIKQAGFYVLVGASMPGVLIETGFLSNDKDERYLASSTGQDEIAEAVLNSLIEYKKYYDEQIEEGT